MANYMLKETWFILLFPFEEISGLNDIRNYGCFFLSKRLIVYCFPILLSLIQIRISPSCVWQGPSKKSAFFENCYFL